VNLLPNMSVADNLFIGREPRRFGFLRRKEMEARATRLMESYGFSLDVREPLNRFSVAMQQIVAICRAIDLSAKVLILDEPTNHLDIEYQLELMTLITKLPVTVVVALHDLNLAANYCQRLVLLKSGSVIASGPPDAVLTPALIENAWHVKANVIKQGETLNIRYAMRQPIA